MGRRRQSWFDYVKLMCSKNFTVCWISQRHCTCSWPLPSWHWIQHCWNFVRSGFTRGFSGPPKGKRCNCILKRRLPWRSQYRIHAARHPEGFSAEKALQSASREYKIALWKRVHVRMRLHLKRNDVIDGKRFSLGDKTQPSEQRGLSVGGWGRDDFCTVLISKCICKFTHTRLLIALFHLPWFLQGPTRKKGLLANYAMRLKGANEMLETESGGGYTTFFTALLEIRKGETPQSFQPQPSRNM